MKVIDLFSGIGGFSLGLERAGFETIVFCEIDPYCRKVLRKHWPNVPIHEDIRTFRGFAVDVITGAFPCQPYSSAARGRNRRDSYLWQEMCRVIQESKPTWVISENVTKFDGLALTTMLTDLESLNYETAVFEIPACALDANHIRRRLWIFGYTNRNGKSGVSIDAQVAGVSKYRHHAGDLGKANGISPRVDRLRCLGSAIVPQIAELIGRAILNGKD